MRQLLPAVRPHVDPAALYSDPPRRRHADGRPWVFANFIASADGATAASGRSGGLANEADKQLFQTLRSLADVVLVGAETARAERYKASRVPGQRIAVVTRSLRLDWEGALMTSGRGVVVAPEDSGAVPEGIPVVRAGRGDVDLRRALHALDAETVLCEGGPTLLGRLAIDGLLDELCLTLSPRLVAGSGKRVLATPHEIDPPLDLELVHVAEDGGWLFIRYRRKDEA